MFKRSKIKKIEQRLGVLEHIVFEEIVLPKTIDKLDKNFSNFDKLIKDLKKDINKKPTKKSTKKETK